jgi:hypothetical protein
VAQVQAAVEQAVLGALDGEVPVSQDELPRIPMADPPGVTLHLDPAIAGS